MRNSRFALPSICFCHRGVPGGGEGVKEMKWNRKRREKKDWTDKNNRRKRGVEKKKKKNWWDLFHWLIYYQSKCFVIYLTTCSIIYLSAVSASYLNLRKGSDCLLNRWKGSEWCWRMGRTCPGPSSTPFRPPQTKIQERSQEGAVRSVS